MDYLAGNVQLVIAIFGLFICTNILIYTYNLYSHPYLNLNLNLYQYLYIYLYLYLYLYSISCLIFGTSTGDLYIYVEIY